MWRIKGSHDLQLTITRPVRIAGKSLYKGIACSATIQPADEDCGLVFEVDGDFIPARHEFMKTGIDGYTTVLKKGSLEIRTVEHLLSAIWGSGIDNAVIKLDSDQIPLIDGSAQAYCKNLQTVGIKRQKKFRKYITFDREQRFELSSDPDRYVIFKPGNNLVVAATSVFKNIIGTQSFSHVWSPQDYLREISWARSFLNSPVEPHGGEVWDNVRKSLPLLPQDPRQSPVIVYTQTEYLTPLKVSNEPVRHKVLDFYGDVSLVGWRIKAGIIIYKPGHNFTREVVTAIASGLKHRG